MGRLSKISMFQETIRKLERFTNENSKILREFKDSKDPRFHNIAFKVDHIRTNENFADLFKKALARKKILNTFKRISLIGDYKL